MKVRALHSIILFVVIHFNFLNFGALETQLPNFIAHLDTLNSSFTLHFFIGFDSYSLAKDLVGVAQANKWKQEGKLISNAFITFSYPYQNPQSIVTDILTTLKNQNISVPTSIKIDYLTTITSDNEIIVRLHVLYFLDQNNTPIRSIIALNFLNKFLYFLKQKVTVMLQRNTNYLSNLIDIAFLVNPTNSDIAILKAAIEKNKNQSFMVHPRVDKIKSS